MDVVGTVEAVGGLSKAIYEYGILIVIVAIFLIVTILLFVLFYKRFDVLFQHMIDRDEKNNNNLNDNISDLVRTMTEVLEIVKINNEGITESAKKYQTYSATIKILKNYFNSLKLEILRNCDKIVEKNNISDVVSVENKINVVIKSIQKKRSIDMREFFYCNLSFSDVIPDSSGLVFESMKKYIYDKSRSSDKLISDLDSIYNDCINEIETKLISCGER